jgi:hypothetical protein
MRAISTQIDMLLKRNWSAVSAGIKHDTRNLLINAKGEIELLGTENDTFRALDKEKTGIIEELRAKLAALEVTHTNIQPVIVVEETKVEQVVVVEDKKEGEEST